MTAHAKERALERIQALSGRGLDVQSFFDEATEAHSAAVPNNGGTGINPFWYTLDPASMLITSMVGICDMPIEYVIQFEYVDDDFNKAVDVARNPGGVQTLKEATGGDPRRSQTYREYMQPLGIEQEALVALRTRRGENWGTVRLVRAKGQEEFSEDDLDFLRVVSPHLAEGARRGLLTGEATEPEGPDAPGLVVLAEDYSVLWMTPAGEELLEELDGEVAGGGPLPAAVLSVAAQALAIAGGDEPPDGGGYGARAQPKWSMVRPERGSAGDDRQMAGSCHHRAGPASANRSPADGAVRADPARAGDHPARPAGRLHRTDRRRSPPFPPHRPAASQGHLREERRPQPS
jgi:hypothetical protein